MRPAAPASVTARSAFSRRAEAGSLIKELCRNNALSDATFYKWRAKFSAVSGLVREAGAGWGGAVPLVSTGGANRQRPEFTRRAFMAGAHAHGIRHILIQSGCPGQNGYIERFNGKSRDYCLNECWSWHLPQARTAVAVWRTDCNEVRPHGS